MKIKIAVLNVLLSVSLAVPTWAASKSATVQFSCTIKPSIQLSAPAFNKSVEAKSNLGSGKQYQMTEDFREQAGQKVRLYSLTAL